MKLVDFINEKEIFKPAKATEMTDEELLKRLVPERLRVKNVRVKVKEPSETITGRIEGMSINKISDEFLEDSSVEMEIRDDKTKKLTWLTYDKFNDWRWKVIN